MSSDTCMGSVEVFDGARILRQMLAETITLMDDACTLFAMDQGVGGRSPESTLIHSAEAVRLSSRLARVGVWLLARIETGAAPRLQQLSPPEVDDDAPPVPVISSQLGEMLTRSERLMARARRLDALFACRGGAVVAAPRPAGMRPDAQRPIRHLKLVFAQSGA